MTTRNPVKILLSAFVCLWLTQAGLAQTHLSSIRDFRSSCDHLIVTPVSFLDCALRLADHRNAFDGDDVTAARVVTIESIDTEFNAADSLRRSEALWRALHCAWHTWPDSLTYVVFVGDDRPGCCTPDTSAWSTGPMPTYIYQSSIRVYENARGDTVVDTLHRYSDAFYLSARGDSAVLPSSDVLAGTAAPVLGRIPCETLAQCERYVTKVITFDREGPVGPWRNRVLAFADDFYRDGRRDPILPLHYRSAEKVADALEGRWVSRVYSGEFALDDSGLHTHARDAFFGQANRGNLWNVFFGHGHNAMLSDERFITGANWQSFTNDTMPGVFMMMGCENGGFHRVTDSSMCKQFLFAPSGGAMAYIATANPAYAAPNELLALGICYHHSEQPASSLGRAFHRARTMPRSINANTLGFHFLGDPALRVAGNQVGARLASNGDVIECSFPGSVELRGSYRYTWSRPDTVHFPLPDTGAFYVRDSVFAAQEGSFTGTFAIIPPAQPRVRLTLYAWGHGFESRLDTLWPVASVAMPSVRARPRTEWAIALRAERLTIRGPSSQSPVTVMLHDLRGRNVQRHRVTLSRGSAIVPLSGSSLTAGRLVVRIGSPEATVARSVVVLP